MVRIGIIGCGYWGPNLVRNFRNIRDCEMTSVADPDHRRLEFIKNLYPSLKVTTDPQQLFDDHEIDGVCIATPVSTHYELAKGALASGKHVLVEKPLAATVAQGYELIELAENDKKILMVDHTFLFSGPVRKIREIIDKGELGEVYYFDSVRVNLGLFQHDVNVVWDLGAHDFSIMDYLIDKNPIAVSAIGAHHINYSRKGYESIAYVTVNFHNNIIAHFHLNWLTPVKIRRILIGGSKKMIVYDHLDPDNQVKVFDTGVEIKTKEDIHKTLIQYRTGDMYAPKVDQKEPLELVCRHFIDCITDGKKPITSGETGLRVVKLLEACDRSMKGSGKLVRF